MIRTLLVLSLVATLPALWGCSLCASPYDDAYNAYGGAVPRGDLHHGRVGSAFAPAGPGARMTEGYPPPEDLFVEPPPGADETEGELVPPADEGLLETRLSP